MNIYSDLCYHFLAYFGWKIYHGVEGNNFNVVDDPDLITSTVQRFFDEEKVVCSSVLVVSRAVLMRRYQFLIYWCRNLVSGESCE